MPNERADIHKFTTFSAVRYFAEHAVNSQSKQSIITHSLTVPAAGISCLAPEYAHASLLLVDGIYVGACEVEEYIHAVKERMIPSAQRRGTTAVLGQRCVHSSAHYLANQKTSLLVACGLVDQIIELALTSPQVRCPRCGAMLERFAGLTQLIDSIIATHGGADVRVYGESDSQQLIEWAATQGFTPAPATHGGARVLLDSLVCETTTLALVIRIMRSLWRVPGVRYVVQSEQGESAYSPLGWCASCNDNGPIITRDTIRTLARQGSCALTDLTPEASLMISAESSLRAALLKPLAEIPLPAKHPLCRVQEIFTRLGLAHLPLGTPTSRLSARDVSALALAISTMRVRGDSDLIIVDLPAGIFAAESSTAVAEHFAQLSATHPVVCAADVFSKRPSSPQRQRETSARVGTCGTLSIKGDFAPEPLTHQLHPGSTIPLSYAGLRNPTLFADLIQTLQSGDSNSAHRDIQFQASETVCSIHPIPLYSRLEQRASLLVSELGIAEKLAQLYAASLDARSLGLAAKDFIPTASRTRSRLCPGCRGMGVVFHKHRELLPRPGSTPCHLCHGDRFVRPVSSVLFRGIPYSVMLNQPIERSAPILLALGKIRETVELILELGLGHLPLGMPLALLSLSETRRLALLQGLRAATTKKPAVIVLEEPELGFPVFMQGALRGIRTERPESHNCVWIEVRGR
jgi:hypothetical protein